MPKATPMQTPELSNDLRRCDCHLKLVSLNMSSDLRLYVKTNVCSWYWNRQLGFESLNIPSDLWNVRQTNRLFNRFALLSKSAGLKRCDRILCSCQCMSPSAAPSSRAEGVFSKPRSNSSARMSGCPSNLRRKRASYNISFTSFT